MTLAAMGVRWRVWLGPWVCALTLIAAQWPSSARAGPADSTHGWVSAKVNKKKAGRGKKGRGKNKDDKEASVETPPVAPAVALPEPRALPKGYRAVGLLPLVTLDVPQALALEIEDALLTEIDETKGMRAISPRDMRNDVSSAGLSLDCDGDITCLARAGRYAGAHVAIETRVAALGGTLSISMRTIDTQTSRELVRVAEPISFVEVDRDTEIHRLAVQLLAPDTYVGTLVVQCPEKGADIYLDDKLIGTAPLKGPLKNLRAGPHILRVSKAGFSDLYQFVDVIYKRTATVEVDLSTTTIAGVITAESRELGTLSVSTTEAGLDIRIDGEPRGVTPLGEPIAEVAAGKRRLSLRKAGTEPVVHEVEVRAGQRSDVEVVMGPDGVLVARLIQIVDPSTPLPGEAPVASLGKDGAPAARPTTWRLYAGIGTGGVGAAMLLSTIYTGVRISKVNKEVATQVDGLSSRSDGNFNCRNVSLTECERRQAVLAQAQNSGTGLQTAQNVLVGAGSVLLAAGAGLILWEWLREPTATTEVQATATLAPTEGGGMAGILLTF